MVVNETSVTYDFLAHGAIARDFLSMGAAELLRGSSESLVAVILLLPVVGIHVEYVIRMIG